MPILLIVLVAILIGQVGFWDAIGALLGATLAIGLFFVILIAAIFLAGYLIYRRVRS
jgi:hypothetical protein